MNGFFVAFHEFNHSYIHTFIRFLQFSVFGFRFLHELSLHTSAFDRWSLSRAVSVVCLPSSSVQVSVIVDKSAQCNCTKVAYFCRILRKSFV